MKKIIISICVVLFFVAGLYFLTKNKTQTTVVPQKAPIENKQTVSLVDSSLSVDKTYTAPDVYTVFKVDYSQFKNTSAEFNKQIEDLVTTGIAGQKKDSADNWKARYDTQSSEEKIPQFPKEADKFYFNVSWKPTQENSNFVSFILTTSAFTGGAHGYETLTSFNYDVVNKKEVTLADLFPQDPSYLKTVSDFVRKDLTTQFRTRLEIKTQADEANFQASVIPMMMDGTTPDANNFSVFTFTPDAVTIYFNQYDVAPYSMGQSFVVMPRK